MTMTIQTERALSRSRAHALRKDALRQAAGVAFPSSRVVTATGGAGGIGPTDNPMRSRSLAAGGDP